jgi:hypothetical protein
LFRRLTILGSLPLEKLERADLKRRIDEIGDKGG